MQNTPYWWLDAGSPTAPIDQPALPAHADVVVIGAGLTGLSAARTLAKHGKHVVVVDRGAPGIGASSRNGGQVGGGHRLHPNVLDAQYGHDLTTRLLREAHIDSIAFFTELLKQESIDCDWQPCGRFRGNWTDDEAERTARDLDNLCARIGLNAHTVARSDQHSEIATDLYSGGTVYPSHGAINPAKFTAGLLRAAVAAGAQVVANTDVVGVDGGTLKQVHTARGSITCDSVLVATNGYSGPALPAVQRRVVPVPSFIVATEPLGANRMKDLFPKGRMVVESRERHCYFRPSPDGSRIVFGGRAALYDATEPTVRNTLKRLIAQVFPDLGDIA
ncbi:MAG: FAD-binding oxidoreductase, partial [Pseudomonadota bacterium]